MRFRSAKYCIEWLALALFSIVALRLCLLEPEEDAASLLIFLFVIYCVQGLFVEAIGVTIYHEGLSVPRRLLPNFPFIVLWRQWIPSNDIDRIASLGMGRIRVYRRRSGGRPEFAIFNHDHNNFFRLVKQTFPSAVTFRDS
jgi:hypothetical protein